MKKIKIPVVNKMLRMEIAKLRGWTKVREATVKEIVGRFFYSTGIYNIDAVVGFPPELNAVFVHMIPKWESDLNAMHQLECELTDAEYNKYCDVLWNMCHNASGKGGAINATARQRAEAFMISMVKK